MAVKFPDQRQMIALKNAEVKVAQLRKAQAALEDAALLYRTLGRNEMFSRVMDQAADVASTASHLANVINQARSGNGI